MRLGFVGVGKWAQKLKAAFVAEGATVVANARSNPPSLEFGKADDDVGFGRHVIWQDFLAWHRGVGGYKLDAVVACGPPDITTEVAVVCAQAGIPVMATKPLMLEQPVPIRAPFYVDFWRLWDEPYQALRAELSSQLLAMQNHVMTNPVQSVFVEMTGSGPIRSFPGLLDYGTHAVAMMRDLVGDFPYSDVRLLQVPRSDAQGGETFEFEMSADNFGGRFTIKAGNAERSMPRRLISVSLVGGGQLVWEEDPLTTRYTFGTQVVRSDKPDGIRRMCRSFMNDISEGFVTTEHLDLSCAVMRDLAEVRRLADEGAKR